MPTTLPIRRSRIQKWGASVGDVKRIAIALVIGAAALWIAFGSPVFSQPNASPPQIDNGSP